MSVYQTKHVLGISVGDILLNRDYNPYFLVMDFKLRLLNGPRHSTNIPALNKLNSTYHETLNEIETPPLPRAGPYQDPYYIPIIKGSVIGDNPGMGSFYLYYYENNKKQEISLGAYKEANEGFHSLMPRLFSKGIEFRDWKSSLARCYCYVL
jgi:hypothetical protein